MFPSSSLHLCRAGLTCVNHAPFCVVLRRIFCACSVHSLTRVGQFSNFIFILFHKRYCLGEVWSASCLQISLPSGELVSIILSFWDGLCHANQGSQTDWAGSSQGPNRCSLLIENGRIIAGLWLSTRQQTPSRSPNCTNIDSGWCSTFYSHWIPIWKLSFQVTGKDWWKILIRGW